MPRSSLALVFVALAAASGCASAPCPSGTTPNAVGPHDAMPEALATRSTRQSHLDAGKTLVLMSVSEEAWQTLVRTMTDATIATNAELRPLRPAFEQFFREYVTRDELATRLAPIYVRTFSELELRQMIWFYSTPTGKKALVKLPELMEAGGEAGRRIVQDHEADLRRILEDYIARNRPRR